MRVWTLLLIVMVALWSVACGGGQAENESVSEEIPEYDIIRDEACQQGGVKARCMNITTSAKSEADFRLIMEEQRDENSGSEAVVVQFLEAKQGTPVSGGGYYFQDEVAARSILGPAYTDSDLNSIMEQDDGMLIISISDVASSMSQSASVRPETVTSSSPAAGEETTMEAMGNIALSGVMGENIETSSFDYRILDYFVTDNYYYLEDAYLDIAQDAFSKAGKFVVVNYSVTNTSPQNVEPNLGAVLHARSGDMVEVYEESSDVVHPASGLAGMELAPRQVGTSQFIFDVPEDVEPELVVVSLLDEIDEPISEAGAIDLTEQDPQGPRPEEILALQYEYANMYAWDQAYDLFAQQSKDQVTPEEYAKYQNASTLSITDYAFPSVEVQGNTATVDRVLTIGSSEGEEQNRRTQKLVLEDEGWRVLMRDEQIQEFSDG